MKSFGRALLSITVKFLLVILPVITAINVVFGTPKHLQTALAKNDVYANAVDSLIEEIEKSSQPGQSGEFPIADPAIQLAIRNAFPSSTLQAAGENVIDGVYGWLNGDSKQPEFSIDLAASKQKLAEGISAVAAARLLSLPTCSYAQLSAIDSANIDAFSVECRPATMDVEAERQRMTAEIMNSTEFLEKTNLTANDLPKNESGQTIAEQISMAPTVFSVARSTPMIVGFLLLLAILGWVLLYEDRWKGIRAVSFSLAGSGVFILVMFGLFGWLFNQANKPGGLFSGINTNEFSRSISGVVSDLSTQANRIILWFGIAYLIIGGATWLTLKFIVKKPAPVVKSK